MDDFERTELIFNGYFYTMTYAAKHITRTRSEWDSAPLIYCVGPARRDPNNFIGINLHHIPIPLRVKFILTLQRSFKFMDDDSQVILSEETLNKFVPGILFGAREYDRANVYAPERIINAAVPKYIFTQGAAHMAIPNQKLIEYMIKTGLYTDAEHTS